MVRRAWMIVCVLVALSVLAVGIGSRRAGFRMGDHTRVDRPPVVYPDYANTVIPPNIAPLNFSVKEPGTRYRVEIASTTGEAIRVLSRSPGIMIPLRAWKQLLEANRGEELRWSVYAKRPDGGWTGFRAFTNRIAREDIDSYLVYRSMATMYLHHQEPMVVYQRNLTNFDISPVLRNESFDNGCLNCHSFLNKHTGKMTLGIRSDTCGSSVLIAHDGGVDKVDTKFGFTTWHPSGRLVAYSLNKVSQFLHSVGDEMRGVVDLDSDLAYYEVESHEVKTTPGISEPDRLETYPNWSADGKYLYFSSAPLLWSDRETVPPEHYDEVRYDLRRIDYDIETDTWGKVETVLSSQETGLSVLMPRVSPDGKHLLFCMTDYGCFPITHPTSDLYLMDLDTGQYRPLTVNSGRSESWHSWSSDGRWFAFTSKRDTGYFARLYLSYLDESGEAHKPVLLPQKDPTYYDNCLKSHNTPELIAEPVRVSPTELADAVRSPSKLKVELPVVSMTRKREAPAPSAAPHPHHEIQ